MLEKHYRERSDLIPRHQRGQVERSLHRGRILNVR
jgi:hypothetical protein